MAIRQSVVNRPKRLTAANPEQIRAYLSQFTEKEPALVTREVYAELSRRPDLHDLMKLVKVSDKAPREDVHHDPDPAVPRAMLFDAFKAGWDARKGSYRDVGEAWQAMQKVIALYL